MGRVIKFLWFVSLIVGMIALLYTYASLADEVVFGEYTFGKEAFFYGALGVLVLFNFTFYAISRNLRYKSKELQEAMANWQLSFAGVLNLFFIVSVFFIMLLNGGEQFDFSNYGYLVYICLGLILIWVIALPIVIGRVALRK